MCQMLKFSEDQGPMAQLWQFLYNVLYICFNIYCEGGVLKNENTYIHLSLSVNSLLLS